MTVAAFKKICWWYPAVLWKIDSWHIESSSVEPFPLAQLLNNLHQDPLTISFRSGFISFCKEKPHLVTLICPHSFDNIEGPFAQGLAHRVEEYKHEVSNITFRAQSEQKFSFTIGNN